MKLVLTTCIALAFSTVFADDTKENLFERYLQGTYLLIGKHLDSSETYFGEVSIALSESGLSITRMISGKIVHGTASIAQTTSDHIPPLKMRFSEDGNDYEESCVVANDLDNYARITCYLYIPGTKTKNPGMEALFIKPRSP